MTSTSLFIGIPAYGGIDGAAFQAHLELTRALHEDLRVSHTFHVADNLGDIVRVRNGILAAFMRSSMTHMLMVDADIRFPVSAVRAMLESGLEFVGAAIPVRSLNFEGLRTSLAGASTPPSGERLRQRIVRFNIEPAETLRTDKPFLKVKAVGTAMLMVRRDAIERMAKGYPELEHVDTDGNMQVGLFNHVIDRETRRIYGEDISFCRRYAALGSPIYCYTQAQVTHTGPIAIHGNLWDVASNLAPYVQHSVAR